MDNANSYVARAGFIVGALSLTLSSACGDSGGGTTEGPSISASGVSISASASQGSDSESTTGNTTGVETTAASGIKLDVGAKPDGGLIDGPCRKVDVILAVDNSGTMQEEVDALRGPVFSALPDQLIAVGNGLEDFHLAVIDGCPTPAYYHNWGKDGACDYWPGGSNYMVSSSPDLDAEFACVTNLTNAGYNATLDMCVDAGDLKDDDEQPALTAATSVSQMAQVANSGFLRDDAVLWVIAITDEDEEGYGPDAQGIAQMLIDAKGDVNDIVFLGVGGKSSCDGPYGSAQNAGLLQSVTAVFEQADRGVFWDLCQGDLPQAFADTIPKVDKACNQFIPG